jgi:hypothetical protein
MNVHTVLALAALAGSIYLVLGSSARIAAVIAVVAAGLDVLIRLGVLHFGVSGAAGISVGLVIGIALAAPGVLAWLSSTAKTAVSAATVVALVGILKVVLALGIRV